MQAIRGRNRLDFAASIYYFRNMFRNSTARRSTALPVMYAGMALTLVAALAPVADRATTHVLADHVRAGYPAYSPARVDTAVTAWVGILVTVGVLGLASWIVTIRAVRAEKTWARPVATTVFAAATCLALTALLTKDTSGEVSLAPALGVLGVLPCLAGLGAVVALWRSH